MSVLEAVNDLVRKAQELDRRELMSGLPALFEQDRTDGERLFELRARVNLIALDEPSQDNLDALGAQVIAWKRALAMAEEVRPTSGDAA